MRNRWPETHLPEIKSIVQEARIIREFHWTYRDLRATPSAWLRERLHAISAEVAFEGEKHDRSFRQKP